MTCLATSGNGAMTGMGLIRLPRLTIRKVRLAESYPTSQIVSCGEVPSVPPHHLIYACQSVKAVAKPFVFISHMASAAYGKDFHNLLW